MRRAIAGVVAVTLAACGAFAAADSPVLSDAVDAGTAPDATPADGSIVDILDAPELDAGEPAVPTQLCNGPGVGIADGFERPEPVGSLELTVVKDQAAVLNIDTGASPRAACPTSSLHVKTKAGEKAALHRDLAGVVTESRVTWSFVAFMKSYSKESDSDVEIARLSFAEDVALVFRVAGNALTFIIINQGQPLQSFAVATLTDETAALWNLFRVDLALGPKPRATVRYGKAADLVLVARNVPLGLPALSLKGQDLGITAASPKGAIEAFYDWNLIYPTR